MRGLKSPVRVNLNIGGYYGHDIIYDGKPDGSNGNPDFINGEKSIPVQFLIGYEDTLRVNRCIYNRGKKPQTDKLNVKGAITMSVSPANQDLLVHWGGYNVVLPAENIIRSGDKMVFTYKKPKGSDSSIAAALFDLEKCTFKIVIDKTDIGEPSSPIDFGIQFGDFEETATVSLRQKKANVWVYP